MMSSERSGSPCKVGDKAMNLISDIATPLYRHPSAVPCACQGISHRTIETYRVMSIFVGCQSDIL